MLVCNIWKFLAFLSPIKDILTSWDPDNQRKCDLIIFCKSRLMRASKSQRNGLLKQKLGYVYLKKVYINHIILVNCQWSSWSSYSECAKSCGGGTKHKTREKTITESNGGNCSGEREYTTVCNNQNCPGKLTKVEKHPYSNDKCSYLIFEISCHFFLQLKPS